jgi:hypothetical protein
LIAHVLAKHAVAATAVGVFLTQQAAGRIQSQLRGGRLEKRHVEFPRAGATNLGVPLNDVALTAQELSTP